MLTHLPLNSEIFIDANILIYHFSGPTDFTPACTKLLSRIEKEEIKGYISTIVLAEILHRLMIIEAVGKFGIKSCNTISYLKTHPSQTKTLTQHLLIPDKIKEIGINILTVTFEDIDESKKYKKEYGLLTNDAINLSLMKRHNLTDIATNDSDFNNIKELNVWKPTV